MARYYSLASLLLVPITYLALYGQLAATKPQQVTLNGHTFTLPPGFAIELVAGPPLVNRPISADFDEEGRLYVTDSSGSNEPVKIQVEKKPHRIVRLEDTDGDGRFDTSVVFAERMMFPEGALWHAGSLYVAAPPAIWKLTDTDGDGVADQREEWFQGTSLGHCANDLHGPFLGPDGWIYWCKGAWAQQSYERPGQAPFVTRAAHIFRRRPDGGMIEPVMTGGMDNPVDVAFTPGGERIFTTTFFQYPSGGQRDGLIHAVYGGIYGKEHDPIYEHKWTAPTVMPVLTHLGPAAPCGLARFESAQFGKDYQDNLFACLFNMQKVTRHVLQVDGATFKTRDEDFLVSTNRDFHPTDVFEDADGSLLVVDTGGWYKLCCPTSQLVKPDVLGGIYRIRRQDAPKVEDPRGRKLAWGKLSVQQLADLLADARPAVRQRAIATLAGQGPEALPVLAATIQSAASVVARRSAVWAATRIDQAEARAVVRLALADTDETVRQAALHSISVRRDQGAVALLTPLLKNPSRHNRRAAAEALGRLGDPSAIPALLEALRDKNDRVLEHALTYALIEIGAAAPLTKVLARLEPKVQRAVLIALDQMDGKNLEARVAADFLTAADPALREAAAWIAGRHPEWGGELAGYYRRRLTTQPLAAADREALANELARLARHEAIQLLLGETVQAADQAPVAARVALLAMARCGLKKVPERWFAEIAQALTTKDAELLREVVATAGALPAAANLPSAFTERLTALGKDERQPEPLRLAALAAVPARQLTLDDRLFSFVVGRLSPDLPVAVRAAATEALARAKLSPNQLLALTDSLKVVGPTEADRLLQIFAQTTEEKIGLRVVETLKNAPIRSSLAVGLVRQRLAKYGPRVQQEAEQLYTLLSADTAQQRAKLEQLLASLKNGDIRRGQAIFNNPKAACSSCHAIGYLGGKVGPDLTRIGQIRTERDLLESIVFPSASFVQGFEPVVVVTRDGKVHNGLVRKSTPEEILLTVAANQEVRIAREDVEEMQPSKVSVMPAGLDQQLSVQDLADLVAFLKACK